MWRQFCATMGKIDPLAGQELSSLGLPDEDTLTDAAYALADITCERETWLFLDDFHNLERATGSVVWKEFFRHRTENLRVVIVARQLDDINLRYQTRVAWLDFSDLALREDEVKKYFEACGVRITKQQATTAQDLTNGCIQGLRLEMDRYAETGGFGGLEDEDAYHGMIRATIWKGLTEEQKNFLLRVSPFERYTLDQAAFLLGLPSGKIPRYVTGVSNDRAFVHHIASDIYYNPHSRILNFCRAELKSAAKNPGLRTEIFDRAAEWRLECGDPASAVIFYYMNGDYDKALSVDI
jgi:LuxR family maltose regulon positive regulatory protein